MGKHGEAFSGNNVLTGFKQRPSFAHALFVTPTPAPDGGISATRSPCLYAALEFRQRTNTLDHHHHNGCYRLPDTAPQVLPRHPVHFVF